MAKLASFAANKKMAALWKEISPGKKKAVASGAAGSASGSSSGTQSIANLVAAAAARAVEKSAAAMHAQQL